MSHAWMKYTAAIVLIAAVVASKLRLRYKLALTFILVAI